MKTVHVFLGSDLRSGHLGLAAQAQKNKVSLKELEKNEAVVFINRKKNKMKAYAYNGVLSYVRFDDPKRGIDLGALDEFPKAFDAEGQMDYSKALRAALEKKLKVRRFGELEIL